MIQTSDFHFPYIPERLQRLSDLAVNLWFSWHTKALGLFQYADAVLWEDVYHNPVNFLHQIGAQRLEELAKDQKYLDKYDTVIQAFDHYMNSSDTWFMAHHADKAQKLIGYFSMEFGIHECLPTYSGGLGILAGDHLKSASDLGIPLVGVGLLYRESYFTQFLSPHGHQQSVYISNDFADMAITPVKKDTGDILLIHIQLDNQVVAARIWKAQVGRVPLFLLDTDFPENPVKDRTITQRLYVADRDQRLFQEMFLGIGGVKALKSMGLEPAVYHMNEGHCAFLTTERMCQEVSSGLSLEDAREKIRASTVFTTHTPVEAGNEVFAAGRILKFFPSYCKTLGICDDTFLKTGQSPSHPDPNAFNMTILSLNMSAMANGVSQLHGQVARHMWHHLWPDLKEEEVPIGAITNGIHTRTWMTSAMKDLLDTYLGSEWRYRFSNRDFWQKIWEIPDENLWEIHRKLKKYLLDEVRKRLQDQLERNGDPPEAILEAKTILDPNALTIGFARRFAQYKRPTLILRDRERLKKILWQNDRPVQIIFAGKAHPANQPGKSLIQEVFGESRNPEFRGRIVFVENYDIYLARRLVSGVDLWLNTPRRPMEASGTSGMKVVVNGGLNFSIRDGWWDEAFDDEAGWAIGEDKTYYHEVEQDENDSRSLYQILENEIIPLYYNQDENGVPAGWVKKMKSSMQRIIPQFNTDRMLMEYLEKMYIPSMR